MLHSALGDLEIRFSNAVISERIRMSEEVERLRSQVGVLRREVWFSSKRSASGMGSPVAAIDLATSTPGSSVASANGVLTGVELRSTRRLSGMPHLLVN